MKKYLFLLVFVLTGCAAAKQKVVVKNCELSNAQYSIYICEEYSN